MAADYGAIFALALVEQNPGLREDELIRMMTDSLYLDFFTAGHHLAQLRQKGLVQASERKDEAETDAQGKKVLRYAVSPAGSAVSARLIPQLPANMQKYLQRLHREKKRERANVHHAVIKQLSAQDFLLRLEAKENYKTIFELEVNLPTRDLALQIKEQFEEAPAAVFQKILEVLLTPLP